MIEETRSRRVGPSWLGWVLLGFVVLALVIGGFTQFTKQQLNPNPGGVLGTQTQEFSGQQVNITGKVSDTLGAGAFTLNAPELYNGNLLVINRNESQLLGSGQPDFNFQKGDQVYIYGEIRQFNQQVLERDLNLKFAPNRFAQYGGQPVIIADSVSQNQ